MGAISDADVIAALDALEVVIRQIGARRFCYDWQEATPIGSGFVASLSGRAAT